MALASFDPAELGRFTRAFEDFFYQDDPESMTSYYTENAWLMADGIQPIHGHGAIGRFWRAAISPRFCGRRPPHHPPARIPLLGRAGVRPVHGNGPAAAGPGRHGLGRHHLAARSRRQVAHRGQHLHPAPSGCLAVTDHARATYSLPHAFTDTVFIDKVEP